VSTAPPLEPSRGAASLLTAPGSLLASAQSAGTGTLMTLMVLLSGLLLIVMMCVDAVGLGPRHDYLRRQISHHRRWPPWL
jgi:hypothetical protein